MAKFTVSWWVTFFDHDPEIHYLVDEEFEADSLEELTDQLDEGLAEDEFEPEEQIPDNWDLGNLNLEYGLIKNDAGNEVFRDPDINLDLIPESNRISN